jgi:hypothetical protein
MVIEECDGLVNTETISLDSIRVWARIMGLPDLVRNKPSVTRLAEKLGEVIEVEMGINGVNYVKYARVYLRIKLKNPLMRVVLGRVDPGKEPQQFRVLYEKMPQFCAQCGVIGHVADECGDGSHDPKKFQYGDFMMVPQEDFYYQPRKEYIIRPQASSSRGRGGRGRGGRSGPVHDSADMEEDVPNLNKNRTKTDATWLRKRDMGARDGQGRGNGTLAIMPSTHVANMVETIEGKAVGETTPQKVHTSKKQKGYPSNVSAGSSEECR